MDAYPADHDCPKCGTVCAFTPRPDTQHHGSIRCPQHGFLWIPKPSEDRKPRRRTNKDLRPSVELQVHHIIEVENGGTDDPVNLQSLCRECHAEVHRRRELIARYVAV